MEKLDLINIILVPHSLQLKVKRIYNSMPLRFKCLSIPHPNHLQMSGKGSTLRALIYNY